MRRIKSAADRDAANRIVRGVCNFFSRECLWLTEGGADADTKMVEDWSSAVLQYFFVRTRSCRLSDCGLARRLNCISGHTSGNLAMNVPVWTPLCPCHIAGLVRKRTTQTGTHMHIVQGPTRAITNLWLVLVLCLSRCNSGRWQPLLHDH